MHVVTAYDPDIAEYNCKNPCLYYDDPSSRSTPCVPAVLWGQDKSWLLLTRHTSSSKSSTFENGYFQTFGYSSATRTSVTRAYNACFVRCVSSNVSRAN